MYKLMIQEPPVYGVHAETEEKAKSSIFFEIYKSAMDDVIEIVRQGKECEYGSVQIAKEKINPIVAFVGNRGSGKSTAMTSFASFLHKNSGKGFLVDDSESVKTLNDTSFVSLPIIDSAQLGTSESIIGRITAAMYAFYVEKKQYINAEKRQKFVKAIKKVNELSVMYRNGDWFKKTDSLMNDTYEISQMEEKVSELIKVFFEWYTETDNLSTKNNYLVISVDDLDMSISNSYSIMEEIRKFLFVKNVIVLITLNTEQLEAIFRSEFCVAINNNAKRFESGVWRITDDLAYRYLDKLFPYGRRKMMPEFSLDKLESTAVSYGNGASEQNVIHFVLDLIWKKTLLLLACDDDGDHILIPRNLRSLCNFVTFLCKMPDVICYDAESKEESEKEPRYTNIKIPELKKNIESLEQFITTNLHVCEKGILSEEDEKLSEMLERLICDLSGNVALNRMNAKITGDILYFIKNSCDDSSYYHGLFFGNTNPGGKILNSAGNPECISMGDVMYVVGKIDAKTRCRYIKYLIEIIRTVWSIRMTKEYYTEVCVSNEGMERYRNTVGGLVFNPDTEFCKDFKCSSEQQKGNWVKCTDEIKESYSWVNDHLYANPDSFRDEKKTSEEEKKYVHFSSVLSHVFNDDMNGIAVKYIMPLYSMDLMCRYYNEIHKKMEYLSIKNFRDLMSEFLKGSKDCLLTIKQRAIKNLPAQTVSKQTSLIRVANEYIKKLEYRISPYVSINEIVDEAIEELKRIKELPRDQQCDRMVEFLTEKCVKRVNMDDDKKIKKCMYELNQCKNSKEAEISAMLEKMRI